MIKQVTGKDDALLLSNRAAAYMGLERWVPACADALRSAD